MRPYSVGHGSLKIIALCSAAHMALALTGCSPSKPPTPQAVSVTTTPAPSGYRLPGNVMFSEHWVATPAVDLMSPEGTYIRAYTEADHVADSNPERAAGSYPGFARAARDINYVAGTGFPAKGFFTNWVHSLVLAPNGAASVVVCYAGNVSVNGSFPDNYNIFKQTITIQRSGVSPPANQKGPSRAPLVSVFGDWYTSTLTIGPFMDPDCATDPPPVDKGPVSTPGWPDHPGV